MSTPQLFDVVYRDANGTQLRGMHTWDNTAGGGIKCTSLFCNGGYIRFRPSGRDSTTGQFEIDSSGNTTISGNLAVSGEQTSGHFYWGGGSTTDETISSAWSEHAVGSKTGLVSSGHYIVSGYCVLVPNAAGNARLTFKGYTSSSDSWTNIRHQIFPLPNANSNNWAGFEQILTGYSGYSLCVTCGVGKMSVWGLRIIRVC